MTRTAGPKRMPRHAAPAAVLAVAALALAGCAAGSDSPAGAAASGGTTDQAGAALEPGTVTVFAAASLTEPFEELATRFEAEHPGVEVALNFGGSGGLAEQIVSGAPADVFAAAAEPPMGVVAGAGLAIDPTLFATNTLQLVVPAGNPADVTGLDDLARTELRVALCDPSVPCGAASDALLDRAGIAPAPDTLESDVKAVLTKVSLDEVDAALVYRTDVASAAGAVEGIEVPEAASVVNRYPISVLAGAPRPDAAAAFVAFVTGTEGADVLGALGFGAP
ncbi:molybdate ABC transporter substrate-binding protein [Agromyces marinus]|uniref:Molybdate-binding protein n=1 Tax=Agromyces marinus TaxID=1389020 RepID=A0ABM8H366_9MICO|nr:molybdate ABC transporter substrate-binding protein [Agromyces marinus]UIP59751.1 Molybdate-binding protein ModA [Agromyces marinus]BDZ55170.1 molybdate-binding protein [Agromyces marinus]